ncbi:hypothetical protein M4R22_20010 [Acidovorax sp. GBBC 3334]|uniref:hypothetical protein n=1 Tax=Acidovorax sp. GBBC 3334 TaxID=2940496 RepID=UPI002304AC0A|nr:hypothetical protein [Acidovorax sp. GBBC 3334]MDA8457050.1 hypothetical protein [Acidovorax sp. GBBC 3334]
MQIKTYLVASTSASAVIATLFVASTNKGFASIYIFFWLLAFLAALLLTFTLLYFVEKSYLRYGTSITLILALIIGMISANILIFLLLGRIPGSDLLSILLHCFRRHVWGNIFSYLSDGEEVFQQITEGYGRSRR